MKNYLVGLIAVAASIAGPALAADIPARMPVKATPNQVVAFSWAGIYTASSIGYGRERIEGNELATVTNTFNVRQSKVWTGSHIGVQGQWGNWVLGVEGAYLSPWGHDWGTSTSGADCLPGAGAGITCHARIHNIFTVGGKVGHSFGNWMIYGTGGYANGRINTVATLADQVFSFSHERHSGWYAGAGIDWYVTRFMWSDLILGVEYRHIELSDRTHNDGAAAQFNRTMGADVDMILAKATFKWVGAGPFSMFK